MGSGGGAAAKAAIRAWMMDSSIQSTDLPVASRLVKDQAGNGHLQVLPHNPLLGWAHPPKSGSGGGSGGGAGGHFGWGAVVSDKTKKGVMKMEPLNQKPAAVF